MTGCHQTDDDLNICIDGTADVDILQCESGESICTTLVTGYSCGGCP